MEDIDYPDREADGLQPDPDYDDFQSTITQFLSGKLKPSAAAGAASQSPHRNEDGQSLSDMEFQKYELGERVARGGMGEILSATDLNIKRTVAMKVLLEGKRNSQDNLIRFIEEGQITGQLQHPGIVPVYDLGINEHGNIYYAMKYVDGVTLKHILVGIRKKDPVLVAHYPLSRLLTIFQKVCDAVAFAHSRGVIHRDLKPENIMVGNYGEVMVMDWGLAKLLNQSQSGLATIRTELSGLRSKSGELGLESASHDLSTFSEVSTFDGLESMVHRDESDSLHTIDGQILGTPNYMSPEQATGRVDVTGTTADIYALGGILYHILCLRPPIVGKSFTEMMVNIVRGRIDAPATFNESPEAGTTASAAGTGSSASVNGDVEGRAGGSTPTGAASRNAGRTMRFPHCPAGKIPESLSAVAMKALSLRPSDRYPDVLSLQQDLEAYQGGFATTAEDAGFLKQVVLLVKRNLAVAGISLVSCTGLILVITVSIVQLRNKNVELLQRHTQVQQAKDEVDRQNLQLEEQKFILQDQRAALQATVDELVAEKRRTRVERIAKEEAQLLKVEEKILRRKEEQKHDQLSRLSAPEFIKKGELLAEEQNWSAALATVAVALELDPGVPGGWYLKGRLDFGALSFSDVITSLSRAERADPLDLARLAQQFDNKAEVPGIADLRELSRIMRERGDLVLSRRMYRLSLEAELDVIQKISACREQLQRDNPGSPQIRLQFSVDGDKARVDLSHNPGLRTIDAVTGLSLSELDLSFTDVTLLSAIRGGDVTSVHVGPTPLVDIYHLSGLSLSVLHLHDWWPTDYLTLTQLTRAEIHYHAHDAKGLSGDFTHFVELTGARLYLHGPAFPDLRRLTDVPISHLSLEDTEIDDLGPLRDQSLVYLHADGTGIRSLRPLRKMMLQHLSIGNTPVKDLRHLVGQPIQHLNLSGTRIDSIDDLRAMPLRHLNISKTNVTDFSVLRDLPVTELMIGHLPIVDLAMIKEKKLEALYIDGTYVTDIRPLSGMPLKRLNISGTRVSDLRPLASAPLTYLALEGTMVTSLEASGYMPLRYLNIANTGIRDISPLRGRHLTYLDMANTQVADLGPLAGMPIQELSLQGCNNVRSLAPLSTCSRLRRLIVPSGVRDMDVLRQLPQLEYISDSGSLGDLKRSASDFWASR